MHTHKSGLSCLRDEPLARYTTLGVGGPARFLIAARTEDEALAALDFAREQHCPVFALGGGSNVVVSDTGFPGLVLKIEIPGILHLDDPHGTILTTGAGMNWDAFVDYCVRRNLAGIECLSGIPGTVGGTPIQNVGAYGEEVSEVIRKIRALDLNSGCIVELENAECRFTYRSSIFNTACKNRYIVLRVDFALRSDGKPSIRHQELLRRFANRAPSLSEVRAAVLQLREAKGMVLERDDADSKSAGSFFRNPVLSPEEAASVESIARDRGLISAAENLPRFTAPDGKEKLAAAWLIERAGFHRGYNSGRAGISSKHALAIVNRGDATAQEIINLMHQIQARVLELFGIRLQPEPDFVGFDG
jgi:UDP-N-acetylmuramate dehydrogenase